MISVTLICPGISIVERYTLSVIDLLTKNDIHVHVLTSNNFETTAAAPYQKIELPKCDLFERPQQVSCWVFKDQSQDAIDSFHKCKSRQSRLLIYIARDGDNRFSVERPFKYLSIFCLLLNYDSIPSKTQMKIPHFHFVVATGYHSYDVLKKAFPEKMIRTSLIFPEYLKAQQTRSTLEYRSNINIRHDKFIYFLDINEYIEIKSADAVIRSYATLIEQDPDFKRDTLLLINGLPTLQLQHILNLETFTPDNVNVFLTYYSNGLTKKSDLIESLIGSCNVYMHAVSGGDFDVHANLAQSQGKLVVYTDIDPNRSLYPYGIKVKTTQPYFEGINQAFLRVPKVSEVTKAMLSAYESRMRLMPGVKVKNCLNKMIEKDDHFEERWKNLLKGTVLR